MQAKPRYCVTGKEDDLSALYARIVAVLMAHPELLCELRLDYLRADSGEILKFLEDLPPAWRSQILLANRRKSSGTLAAGECDWPQSTWQNFWVAALELGGWFAIDFDWEPLAEEFHAKITSAANAATSGAGAAATPYTKIIYSLHLSLPEIARETPLLLQALAGTGAGIKLATAVDSPGDLLRFSQLALAIREQKQFSGPQIFAAMGAAGRAWRWSHLAGDISYFAFDAAHPTAPGQSNWEEALPLLGFSENPGLYLLWGGDPNNFYGERRWNAMFQTQEKNARYTALACDPPNTPGPEAQKQWAEDALAWMEIAGVRGASITSPYKNYFSAAPGNGHAVNTLIATPQGWKQENTDGSAVVQLLQERAIHHGEICIIGGGGAAQGVSQALAKAGYSARLWVRGADGMLPALPAEYSPRAFIATWPGKYQISLRERLEEAFPAPGQIELVIDAQFSLAAKDSPLAQWAEKQNIFYVPGNFWWTRQAQAQANLWFGDSNAELFAKLSRLLPRSKSETIRLLALAVFSGNNAEITAPSVCADTEYFRQAMLEMGAQITVLENSWRIQAPESLTVPKCALFVGESATALRFLAALSVLLPAGETLLLDAAPSLRARAQQAIFEALQMVWDGEWPLRIPCGSALPKQLSLSHTSQVVSGFLLAFAAGASRGIYRNENLQLELVGNIRSLPYVELTCTLLKNAGYSVQIAPSEPPAGKLCVHFSSDRFPDPRQILHAEVEADASGAAFLEVMLQYSGKTGFSGFIGSGMLSAQALRQGDFEFPNFLTALRSQNELSITLKDHPDLAPCLWAAALLFQKNLTVHSTPQLHDKESDRALALVDAALAMGIRAENRPDGFFVAGREARAPLSAAEMPGDILRLGSYNDHRIAMAIGCLRLRWPEIRPDDEGCVRKSFPNFWECVRWIEGSSP